MMQRHIYRELQRVVLGFCSRLAELILFVALLASATSASAAIPPAGTIVSNTATSTQQVGVSPQTSSSNSVLATVGPAGAQPTLTKSFGGSSISSGGSTTLSFLLTNATGNPAQSGLAFVDTLPTGLRLTVGASATVSGIGCAAAVSLVAPSSINISAGSMSAGTASCVITVNAITNSGPGNPDCASNPVAFTNGTTSISGIANVVNAVTSQCLIVAAQNGTLVNNQVTILIPGASYAFPHTLFNGPLADTYNIALSNLPGTFNFSNIQIFADANGDGIPDSAVPLAGNIILAPNQAFKFVVVVSVPPSATTGTTDEVRVTATSILPGRLPIPSNIDHVDIFVGVPAPPNLDVSLVKWLNQNFGASPSGRYTVSLRYANLGTIDAAKDGVQVSDTLPAGMTLISGSLRVRSAPGTPVVSLPGTSGTTTLHGAPATYTASPSSVSVIFSHLNPGNEGFIEFDVNIAAGIAVDTILHNTAQVTWLDAMGVPVVPRNSNIVDFRVTGTEGVTLTGMTVPRVDPGSVVTFENVLTNRTGRTDTFDITLSGSNYPQGTVFKLYKPDGITPLPDTNGNGVIDTGPVAADAIYRIIVKAQLPNGSAGGPYSILKNAQSISNPLVHASDNDVVGTIAGLCRVVLEPNNTGRVAPGGSITYSHILTNVGNCTEVITVPSNYLTGVVQGWTAQAFVDSPIPGGQSIVGVLDTADAELTPATTITLPPGGRIVFLDRITAPTNAANGSSNTTTLRINAGSSGLLSVNDVTTVLSGSTGDITDEIVGYIDPGFLRRTVWGFIGKPLYLRAAAPSCNADPTVVERRTIIITGPNGEREELIATETGPDTGMFVADPIDIRLPPVTAADKILEGRPFDVMQVELVGCGKKITTTVTLIDPSGVVFDSRTNQPVAGATVRIITATGGVCTNTPATVSQFVAGQIVPSPSSVVTGADGRFTFQLVSPSDYCLLVTTPNGYTWVSQVPASQLPGGRNILATGPTTGGSYGGQFRVGPDTGPVIVDIPVDGGLIGGLFVRKTVPRSVVEMGEFLDYSVTVNNRTGYALDQSDVFLTDSLPAGFAYVSGSARRDGKLIANPQGGAGPRLVFNLGRMTRHQQSIVTYRIRVGPGAMQGDGINRVVASYRIGAGSTLFSESNVATAKVEIVGGVFSDRAYIIGKIFSDCNNDRVQTAEGSGVIGETGIPGVRVILEDGTSAISDSEGKFSFYGLLAKTHVLKVDRTSLPAGVSAADFSLLSSRNLGKGDSRIVDLKNGELHKANFAIKVCSDKVLSEINKRRLATLSLKTEIDGRLQQKLEADPNLRAASDIKALPASGEVGNTAPTANIAAPLSLGSSIEGVFENGATAAKSPARFDTLAVPQSDVAQKRRARPAREPEIQLESLLPNEDNTLNFIGLKSGDVLPYAQTAIRVKGTAGSTLKLKVNDKEIDVDRVGKKAVFAEKSSQAWEYVGIDLAVGENTLSVAQFDQFGNARGEKTIKVVAPGMLADVKISFNTVLSDGAIADGKTPVRVVVNLLDRNGVAVTSRVAINLATSVGRWNVEDLNPVEPGLQTFVEGGRAQFELIPPTEPGQAQIRVSSGDIKTEAKLDFLPDLRDLIAVGVIEGVLNLRKLDARGLVPARAQDGFEQEILHISRTWANGSRDAGARAAMFLKGKVRGDYLLTMAYDSDKNTRERLFRDIQPDEFYPIYGDSSVRAFDAQSTGRFYVRVDNKKSYLLYGDFNTSQATDARKLSNYSRSLTGVKEHFENSRISANIFASRDSTKQIIDEFAANGTSGPFTLSRASGLINSEKIEILTRDRNQSSVIVRAQPLARFVDYELEPLTGRILFKAPIASLDENLNPISIRITYEIDQGGEQFWVTSADAQVKVNGNIEVGAVVVDDRNPVDKFRMLGINAIAKLAEKTFITAELARTRREAFANALPLGEKSGDAKRVEFRHTSTDLEATLYAARADENFDNPSASLSRGRQEAGGKLAYRIDEKTRIKAELLHTEDIAVGGKRDGLLLAVERSLADGIRVEAGIRHARESQPSLPVSGVPSGIVIPNELTAVRARLTGELPGVKDAAAYVEAEVDVHDSARKIAAVGADYRLGTTGRLYARHEFISSLTGPYGLNSQQRQNSTVVGINTDYMKDGNVFSEYRVRDAISGGDVEAALGLRNLWTLSDGLKLQTGFERVHALSGLGTGEATALTFGVEYTANPLWKGSSRLEVRNGQSSDSILATVAAAAKLGRDWTFLGRNTYSLIKNKGQSVGENEQDRFQLGLAYRQTDTDVWNALGRVEHRVENDSTQPSIELKRTVELISIHANWQPRRPFTFSGRYAAKWVNEKSNGLATKNNAQLLAGRVIWDVAPRWDAGVNVSTMFGQGAQSKQYGLGIEVGFLIMENLWVSGGYNFFGYRDDDLASGEYTNKGAFIRLRYKFDEDLFGAGKGAKSTASKESNGVKANADTKPTADKTEPKEGV